MEEFSEQEHENHEYLWIECDLCWKQMEKDAARYRPHPSVLANERFYANEAPPQEH